MRIKYSNRGLTFSFNETDTFRPGTRYRYIIDNETSEVIILPDNKGKYKFSRKGANKKPLVDLRNSEIKEAMSKARYMEVEVLDDKIIVHMISLSAGLDLTSDVNLAEMIDKPDDVTFSISKDDLKNNNTALYDMLKASGIFSRKDSSDISYVFDTISLFSGAGLLDYPFKQDRAFELKFAVDFDKWACETYKNNIGDHILCMDIRNLDPKDVPETDLIIGGPCCQGYSNANRAKNEEKDVSKRLLIDDYIRMVKAKKPLMFVIENVRQFVTKEHGRYLNRLLSELSGDYNIAYSIVNDNSLSGYTTRDRMILIGSTKDMDEVIIPNVTLSYSQTAGDALEQLKEEAIQRAIEVPVDYSFLRGAAFAA